MIHVLTNALALAPAAANARPSQQVSNLQTIITQVEHFYGEGWHTILWAVGLIAALLGVIAPMLIYLIEWKTFHKKIKKAQRKAHDETEDAKRQTAEVRKEASESIKQQQTAMTALIKQEANKAKRATVKCCGQKIFRRLIF